MTYEILDHAADVRARLRAPDEKGLYEGAVDLVREIVVDGVVRPHYTIQMEVSVTEESERLFRFIRELVYWYDVDGFLPLRLASFEELEVAGERFDPERHSPRQQPKALTRHQYRYSASDEGYEVEMVFDL